MSLKRWSAVFTLAALLATGGCSRSETGPASPPAAPSAEAPAEAPAEADDAMDASWQGVLPCADCDGIQTRLHLIAGPQGRSYELQETYLAGDGGESFETRGTWTRESAVLDDEATVVYRLDTQGASRWYSLQPDGALEMLEGPARRTPDGLAHRLQRL